jgi:hypothetical protein
MNELATHVSITLYFLQLSRTVYTEIHDFIVIMSKTSTSHTKNLKVSANTSFELLDVENIF